MPPPSPRHGGSSPASVPPPSPSKRPGALGGSLDPSYKERSALMKELQGGSASGKGTHQLLICCSRNRPAYVHAAQTLQEALQKVLAGTVVFDPEMVGRFGAAAKPSPAGPPASRLAFIGRQSSLSKMMAAMPVERGTSSRMSRSGDKLAKLSRRDAQLITKLSARLRSGIAKAKAVLDNLNAMYTCIDCDEDEDGMAYKAELATITGGSVSVPAVFVGGEFIGGCNDGGLGGVLPLHETGELEERLMKAGSLSATQRI